MTDTVSAGRELQSQGNNAPKARMKWFDTLFNPLGRSSKVEFTRAWTLLFMLQFLIIVIPFFISIVAGLAGGDGTPVAKFGLYASPVVFIVTTVMSFIIHARRLKDAGKWVALSGIVLLPLFVAMALFTGSVEQSSAEYQKLYEKRAVFLEDPQTWKRDHQIEQRIQQAARTRIQDRNGTISELESDIGDLIPTLFFGAYKAKRANPERWTTRTLAEFKALQARIKEARTIGEIKQDALKAMMWRPDAREETLAVIERLHEDAVIAYKTEIQIESFFLSLLYGVDQVTLADDTPKAPERDENGDVAETPEPSLRYQLMQDYAFVAVDYTKASIEAMKADAETSLTSIGYYTSQRFKNRVAQMQQRGYRADQKLPERVPFILEPNLGTIQMVIAVMSFFIMLWSLIWVARKPTAANDIYT